MRRGPKGAAIETQLEVTATRTWNLGRDFIVARLGLPEDTRLFVDVTYSDHSERHPVDTLVAVAVETRKPAVKP